MSRQIGQRIGAMASITEVERHVRASLAPALERQAAPFQAWRPVVELPQLTVEIEGMLDWHRLIDDIQRSLAPSAALLGRLEDIAAGYLPDNLQGFGSTGTVSSVSVRRTESRWPGLPAQSKSTAAQAAGRGIRRRPPQPHPNHAPGPGRTGRPSGQGRHGGRGRTREAAQALIAKVLETTMKNHANAWIRRTFPSADYNGAPGTAHHRTLANATSGPDSPRDLTLLQFNHYLVLRGLTNTFQGGVSTQDTFNRHLSCHHASHDTYR